MATSVDLGRCWTERTKTRVCKKSLDGPPSALADLTERRNQVLSEIFGIQTVAELGSNKYFALAGALAALANKLESGSVSVLYPHAPCA